MSYALIVSWEAILSKVLTGYSAEEVRQRHVTFMNILISLVLIHDSPYKIVHSVSLIDGLFRCKLQAFPEGTSCENPL